MKENDRQVKSITPKSEDFSKWYVEVVQKAELADYTPMKGMMVIRPHGYAVWESIQKALDLRIKASGHVNAYSPLFIPEGFLKKEAERVAGFSPEVAWVTIGGKEGLERLAVRPTSEAIIGHMYAKWIKSWRICPVLINQWANIVRWQRITRPFLAGRRRSLWQECDTCQDATAEEGPGGDAQGPGPLQRNSARPSRPSPSSSGRKTLREKLRRGPDDLCHRSPDVRRQGPSDGTSHNLGQHFSKAFDIKFEDPQPDPPVRLADVLGHDHPDGRGPDHGPRRRLAPVPAESRRSR